MTSDINKAFLVKFGSNLKKIREGKGFTQAQLAIDSDLDISFISRVENGKISSSVIYLKHISDALNIDIKQLFEFE